MSTVTSLLGSLALVRRVRADAGPVFELIVIRGPNSPTFRGERDIRLLVLHIIGVPDQPVSILAGPGRIVVDAGEPVLHLLKFRGQGRGEGVCGVDGVMHMG